MPTPGTRMFDPAEHLETEEDIRYFLQDAAKEGNSEEIIHALSAAARAAGMTEIAKKAGVTHVSLYKSLSKNGNPKFSTICKVTKALGCKLTVA